MCVQRKEQLTLCSLFGVSLSLALYENVYYRMAWYEQCGYMKLPNTKSDYWSTFLSVVYSEWQ